MNDVTKKPGSTKNEVIGVSLLLGIIDTHTHTHTHDYDLHVLDIATVTCVQSGSPHRHKVIEMQRLTNVL